MDVSSSQYAKIVGGNGVYAGVGGGVSNAIRPETALESVTSRMAAILSRVKANSSRAEGAAIAVLGYEGEKASRDLGVLESAPTSVQDYLRDIEDSLGRLEYHLCRLT